MRACVRVREPACVRVSERVPGLNFNSVLIRVKVSVLKTKLFTPEMEKRSASSSQHGSCSDYDIGW